MIEEIKVGTLVHFIVLVFYRHFTRTVRNITKVPGPFFPGLGSLLTVILALDSTKKSI